MDADQDSAMATLLTLAQEGSAEAYGKFLFEISRVLRGFLERRMAGNDMSEDVLQETLLSVHRARHTYLPGKKVGPWLYAICEHRMTDFYRRYRRLEKREVTAAPSLVDAAAAPVERPAPEQGGRILGALQNLPEKQRRVIEGLKLGDLTVKEVAAKTGMTEGAVKITAFRGYETLRRLLGVKKRENR